MGNKIKILIADDHDLFRTGLTALLQKHEDMEVLRGVSNGIELMSLVEQGIKIEIILLDLTMPEMNGFEVLEKLTKSNQKIKIIILSMHDDGNYIAKCARSGAYSYLLKNTDEEELLRAIRSVARDKKYFGAEISEKMVNFMSIQGEDPKRLSKKESEVLKLLAKGLTTKEIASKLYISTRTVETHRAHIIKKLNVKNTAELIRKSSELGLF